jgi:hypothetical protein
MPVSQLVKDMVDVHNMRLRIQRLKVGLFTPGVPPRVLPLLLLAVWP